MGKRPPKQEIIKQDKNPTGKRTKCGHCTNGLVNGKVCIVCQGTGVAYNG